MKVSNHLFISMAICATAGANLLGCHTIQGAGRDIKEGGNAVENAATEAHEDIRYRNQSSLRDQRYIPGPHTISAFADSGGSIIPSGKTTVPHGSSQTYIATAYRGYEVEDLLVDNRSVGATPYLFQDNSSSYTFDNVAANHVITSSFGKSETHK